MTNRVNIILVRMKSVSQSQIKCIQGSLPEAINQSIIINLRHQDSIAASQASPSHACLFNPASTRQLTRLILCNNHRFIPRFLPPTVKDCLLHQPLKQNRYIDPSCHPPNSTLPCKTCARKSRESHNLVAARCLPIQTCPP